MKRILNKLEKKCNLDNYEQEYIPEQNGAYLKKNTLSEMSLIMDEVGNDHTAKNLPQHNIESCKYIQEEIISNVLRYFKGYNCRQKWLYLGLLIMDRGC